MGIFTDMGLLLHENWPGRVNTMDVAHGMILCSFAGAEGRTGTLMCPRVYEGGGECTACWLGGTAAGDTMVASHKPRLQHGPLMMLRY